MNRAVRILMLILGLVALGPVEELQAIVGVYGPASYRGQSRRVSRRTARRVSRRHAAAYGAAAAPVVATTTYVTTPAPAVGGLPIGTAVAALPPGCASEAIGGLTYYQCAGVFYQPSYSGGNLVYTVVMPPQ